MNTLIISLVIIGTISITTYILVNKAKNKVREFSRTVYGTDTIAEGIKNQEIEYATTPKSVSGITSLCLPQINKDFPEFNYAEFKQIAESQLKAVLLSIDAKDILLLEDADEALKNQVIVEIEDYNQQGLRRCYDKIKIHRTEIAKYQKQSGICRLVLQSAVGYITYLTSDTGEIVSGSKSNLKQTRYNMELVYVQDYDLAVQAIGDNSLGITCPNCGAPVKSLGNKFCEYCGTKIIEVNLNVWKVHAYKEIEK